MLRTLASRSVRAVSSSSSGALGARSIFSSAGVLAGESQEASKQVNHMFNALGMGFSCGL